MSGESRPDSDRGFLVESSGIVVLVPVFNDWESALVLIDLLDQASRGWNDKTSVLLVDDGSSEPMPKSLSARPSHLSRVGVLRLRRNVGHQRAIALGLAYLHAYCTCNQVVVMDGDGEDAPKDVLGLLEVCRANHNDAIVFAKRARRSEGLVFRLGYMSFRTLHRILTGRAVEVGNFSVIPAGLLDRIVGVSEIWNHYAAGVFHARLPIRMLPVTRARRLLGRSKMNFVSLVSHGMSAISVFGDVVGVRLFCATGVLVLLALAGLAGVVGLRLFTDMAIPGWATNAAGSLMIALLNLSVLSIVFVLFILHGRNVEAFIPARDWHHYVLRRESLHE